MLSVLRRPSIEVKAFPIQTTIFSIKAIERMLALAYLLTEA